MSPTKQTASPTYYPVKTGDTFEAIAKACGQDDPKALIDLNKDGAATHLNFHLGEGQAEKTADSITAKTKLIEGQSLLLPEGWALEATE